MNIILIPKENFDIQSINTITKVVNYADKILSEWKIHLPEGLEFYDDVKLFIERILSQVKRYGLTRDQSVEFIKASLNYGSYGTFDISKNTIIEMNFNPYFKFFYPTIHFLRLIIHESLHLFLYSKLDKDIYNHKFKFLNGEYVGEEKIIQLDEGFSTFLTKKILENFNFKDIKTLPIYSSVNEAPLFRKKVKTLNIEEFNKNFNTLYEKNTRKGVMIIKNKFDSLSDLNNIQKIEKLVYFIKEEISKT